MPNINSPNGLRPSRHLSGRSPVMRPYSIASAYNANIFTGDVVEMTGTGKNLQVAAAGNVDNIGVFAGCEYTDATGRRVFSHYWPASTVATDIVAYVWDDPDIIFEVQCDTLAAGDIGTLVDWDDGAGSTATGMSGRSAVGSSTGTTGKSLRVHDLVRRSDNAYGSYARAEVIFIEHVLKGVVSGVGGI